MFPIGCDNGDDGPCVFGRLAWANSQWWIQDQQERTIPILLVLSNLFWCYIYYCLISNSKSNGLAQGHCERVSQGMCTGRCEEIVTMPRTVYHIGQKCHISDMLSWGKNIKSQAIKKELENYDLKAKFCLLPVYIKFYWNRAIFIICILSTHALMIQWLSWVDATEYVLPEKLKIFMIWPIIENTFVG